MTWWRIGLDTGLNLMTLTTSAPWDLPGSHKNRIYSDGDRSFHERDIAGNFDEVEEALWAFRNGLTDLSYIITIKMPKK